MGTGTDRIEKKILLHAPIDTVWRAISDAEQFGTWFGARFTGSFVAGARITGTVVPTKVDAAVAATQSTYEGASFDFTVDRIEPPRLFSFRWHPFAVDQAVDYAKEPPTLVIFELQETAGGTLLTITESGFDGIPLARRAKAFAMNDEGWSAQTQLLEKYLARAK
jgi:uncharacterized protein YndB with AHSA1/START domain